MLQAIRKRAAILIASAALGLSGCNSFTIFKQPPLVRAVCEDAETLTREFNRVVCEIDAALLEYEGAAVAAEAIIDGSLAAPEDKELEAVAIKLGQLNAKASPAAELVKIARDKAVYLDEANASDASSIEKAAQAYAALNAAWREAQPTIERLRNEWAKSPEKKDNAQ